MYKKIICLIIVFSRIIIADVCSDRDYVNLAKSLRKNNRITESIEVYKKALKLNPDNFSAHWDLATEFFKQCNYQESLKHFCKLADSGTSNPYIFFNIGYIFFKLGQLDKAEEFLRRFLKLQPDSKDTYKFLGRIQVTKGNFKAGYDFYNRFYGEQDLKQKKLWRGSDVSGKIVYIWNNIGMGDVFCFIQYARKLKNNGATVILGVREGLIPIMSSCPYVDKVVPRFGYVPECDFIVDLNRLTRMSYRAGFGVPCGYIEPYLFANKGLVKKYKQLMSQDKCFKIGLCWDAYSYKNKMTGEKTINERSIPLYYLYFLSKLEKISLYSLQRVNGTEQLDFMPQDFKIHIFGQDFDKTHGSFSDTVAVMQNLDLVITADTSVANLAGALGVNVWVLLPFAADWRWQVDKSYTDWYPTMRLFRQDKPGNWEHAINKVCCELCSVLREHNGGSL
ncbi:tetratricopeptide repeat protein [Candidatus Dependentiae bacterium]